MSPTCTYKRAPCVIAMLVSNEESSPEVTSLPLCRRRKGESPSSKRELISCEEKGYHQDNVLQSTYTLAHT